VRHTTGDSSGKGTGGIQQVRHTTGEAQSERGKTTGQNAEEGTCGVYLVGCVKALIMR